MFINIVLAILTPVVIPVLWVGVLLSALYTGIITCGKVTIAYFEAIEADYGPVEIPADNSDSDEAPENDGKDNV